MKFLGLIKQKEVALTLPPAVVRQLIEVSLAGMNQLKKAGKYLEGYYSPAGLGMVILNYNNADEWVKDQNLVPMLQYYEQELYPLADMEESFKTMLEALKAAEKMMGSAPR
jgi:hypothetical protein